MLSFAIALQSVAGDNTWRRQGPANGVGRRHPVGETQLVDEQTVLDEIVSRIREVANPERIVLFGSRARGEAGT